LLWAMPLLDQLINFLIKCAQTWDVFVCDLYVGAIMFYKADLWMIYGDRATYLCSLAFSWLYKSVLTQILLTSVVHLYLHMLCMHVYFHTHAYFQYLRYFDWFIWWIGYIIYHNLFHSNQHILMEHIFKVCKFDRLYSVHNLEYMWKMPIPEAGFF
jgi:hypothetical protein